MMISCIISWMKRIRGGGGGGGEKDPGAIGVRALLSSTTDFG